MDQTKTNKRGWVKNAAIIFLAVLLLLTFFSNTIMNRSLPEISGSYAQSGAITTRISGSGTVEAVDSFSVEVKQVRDIASIAVRVGDTVEVGDVLFYLAGTESDELDTLTDQLYDLQIAYRKAVIQKTGKSYDEQDRDIQQAREELVRMQADLLTMTPITAAEVSRLKADAASASTDVVKAQDKLDDANADLKDIQRELDRLGKKVESSDGDSSARDAAEDAMDFANAYLGAQKQVYGDTYDIIYEYAKGEYPSSPESYMIHLRDTGFAEMDDVDPPTTSSSGGMILSGLAEKYADAYDAITDATADLDNAKAAFELEDKKYKAANVTGNSAQYNRLTEELQDQQDVVADRTNNLAAATKEAEAAEKEYTEADAKLKNYESEYDAAVKAVQAQKNSIEDLEFALDDQQREDMTTGQIDDLDLQAQGKAISDLQADIAEMREEGIGSEIISAVAGVVSSVNVSAGNTANPATSLMDIDIADRGYTMSFTVSTEQARSLQVGTVAEVSMNYWNSVEVTASLTAIKPDTKNPTTSRILQFSVEGDTAPGATLRLSVGQKSQNFETVVPNSAVKTDSNGTFVLIIEAKSSPLSTRYIARRVEVTVLAKDDLTSAVSGALTNSDFVITTSSKPIEAGMQVKMPE